MDDKDDNSAFACPVGSPVGAMLMPALGNKIFLFFSKIGAPPNWSPPFSTPKMRPERIFTLENAFGTRFHPG